MLAKFPYALHEAVLLWGATTIRRCCSSSNVFIPMFAAKQKNITKCHLPCRIDASKVTNVSTATIWSKSGTSTQSKTGHVCRFCLVCVSFLSAASGMMSQWCSDWFWYDIDTHAVLAWLSIFLPPDRSLRFIRPRSVACVYSSSIWFAVCACSLVHTVYGQGRLSLHSAICLFSASLKTPACSVPHVACARLLYAMLLQLPPCLACLS